MSIIKSILRVLALSAVLLGAAAHFTLRRAEAHLAESLRGFGEQIARLDGFRTHSAPRQLFVNGLEFRVVSLSTSLDVEAALDRFQAMCHHVGRIDMPAQVRREFDASVDSATGRDVKSKSQAVPHGVIRATGDGEGMLACLDVGSDLGLETFLQRLTEFGKSGQLAALGQFRFALARRGEQTSTLFIVWTEGNAKLSDMFPKDRDAPGVDIAGLPRPVGGRRLLSGYEQGRPYGFAAYEIEGQRAAVVKDYESRIRVAGWRAVPTKQGGLLAERSGRRVVVQFREARSGLVVVTLADLG